MVKYFGKLFPGVSSYSKEYFRLYARMKRKDPAYMEARRIYNKRWMREKRRLLKEVAGKGLDVRG
jgi:hypothetical protein